jgi:hypothetical protein
MTIDITEARFQVLICGEDNQWHTVDGAQGKAAAEKRYREWRCTP